jgi:hypothetical protein
VRSRLANAFDVVIILAMAYTYTTISTDPGKWEWLVFHAETKKVLESGEASCEMEAHATAKQVMRRLEAEASPIDVPI